MWEINNPNNRQALSFPNNGIYDEEKFKNDKSVPIPERLKKEPISVGTVAYAFLTEDEFIGLGKAEWQTVKDLNLPRSIWQILLGLKAM